MYTLVMTRERGMDGEDGLSTSVSFMVFKPYAGAILPIYLALTPSLGVILELLFAILTFFGGVWLNTDSQLFGRSAGTGSDNEKQHQGCFSFLFLQKPFWGTSTINEF